MKIRISLYWLSLLLVLMVCIEGFSFSILNYLKIHNSTKFLIWDPDINIIKSNWITGMQPDSLLSWPSTSSFTNEDRDINGAKFNKFYKKINKNCISVYGASFVWGEGSPRDKGWVEELERIIKCPILNFGVNGYGLDQSYLRYLKTNINTENKLIILGIHPENIERNLNQFIGFLGNDINELAFKSRFIVDNNNQLLFIPKPNIDFQNIEDFINFPKKYLNYEYFLPGTTDGQVLIKPSYTLNLFKFITHQRIISKLSIHSSWAHFYNNNETSQSLELTHLIIKEFDNSVQRNKQKLLLVFIPGASSFKSYITYHKVEYINLLDKLNQSNINYFDPTEYLLNETDNNYCLLFQYKELCDGHLSEYGNKIYAKFLASKLIN